MVAGGTKRSEEHAKEKKLPMKQTHQKVPLLEVGNRFEN